MINKVNTPEVRHLAEGLNPPQPSLLLARFRLILRQGETYTLSADSCEVRILSGAACLLEDGREVTLMHGEKRAIPAEQSGSAIGGFGDEPLIFEIALDVASEEAQRLKRQFYDGMAKRQQCIETEHRRERQCS